MYTKQGKATVNILLPNFGLVDENCNCYTFSISFLLKMILCDFGSWPDDHYL